MAENITHREDTTLEPSIHAEDRAAGLSSIWIFTSSQEAHKKKVLVFVNAPGFGDDRWAGSTKEECEVVRKHKGILSALLICVYFYT